MRVNSILIWALCRLMQCNFNFNVGPLVRSGSPGNWWGQSGWSVGPGHLVCLVLRLGRLSPGAACTVKSLNRHWRPQLARKMKFVKLLPVAFRKWSPSEHCNHWPRANFSILTGVWERGLASRGNWYFGWKMSNCAPC